MFLTSFKQSANLKKSPMCGIEIGIWNSGGKKNPTHFLITVFLLLWTSTFVPVCFNRKLYFVLVLYWLPKFFLHFRCYITEIPFCLKKDKEKEITDSICITVKQYSLPSCCHYKAYFAVKLILCSPSLLCLNMLVIFWMLVWLQSRY